MKLVDQFGPEKTDQVAADRMKVLRGMKALVDKEKLDCEFMLRRSFDVFWDEAQAKEMKESLQDAIAAGYSWPKDIQWLEGEHLEKVMRLHLALRLQRDHLTDTRYRSPERRGSRAQPPALRLLYGRTNS